MRPAFTPRRVRAPPMSAASSSAARLCRRRYSRPFRAPIGRSTEMWLTVMLATIAGLGVLVAGIAAAMPAADPPGDSNLKGRWQSGSLRGRIYSPFEAIANRGGRRKRLTGGLTLGEQLVRADLKFRTSEFVMIQVAFLIGGAAISLWRFGFGPQFVIAGVAAYLMPMRYVKFRQRRRLVAPGARVGLTEHGRADRGRAWALDPRDEPGRHHRAGADHDGPSRRQRGLRSHRDRDQHPFLGGREPRRHSREHLAHDPPAHPHQVADLGAHGASARLWLGDHPSAIRRGRDPLLPHAGIFPHHGH